MAFRQSAGSLREYSGLASMDQVDRASIQATVHKAIHNLKFAISNNLTYITVGVYLQRLTRRTEKSSNRYDSPIRTNHGDLHLFLDSALHTLCGYEIFFNTFLKCNCSPWSASGLSVGDKASVLKCKFQVNLRKNSNECISSSFSI